MPLPNLIVGCDDHIATRIFLYYLSNFYPHHRKRSPSPCNKGRLGSLLLTLSLAMKFTFCFGILKILMNIAFRAKTSWPPS